MRLANYKYSAPFSRILHALVILYFGLAFALAVMGTMVLEGSDYAKLQRDPLAAAAFTLYVVCLQLLAKCPRMIGSVLCLTLTGVAFQRGHNYGALLLLAASVFMLQPQKN